MVTLRKLEPETVAKYLELEKVGALTPRQAKALAGHRVISDAEFVEAWRKGVLETKRVGEAGQ